MLGAWSGRPAVVSCGRCGRARGVPLVLPVVSLPVMPLLPDVPLFMLPLVPPVALLLLLVVVAPVPAVVPVVEVPVALPVLLFVVPDVVPDMLPAVPGVVVVPGVVAVVGPELAPLLPLLDDWACTARLAAARQAAAARVDRRVSRWVDRLRMADLLEVRLAMKRTSGLAGSLPGRGWVRPEDGKRCAQQLHGASTGGRGRGACRRGRPRAPPRAHHRSPEIPPMSTPSKPDSAPAGRQPPAKASSPAPQRTPQQAATQVAGSAGATVSGPTTPLPEGADDIGDLSQSRLVAQRAGAQSLAAAMPHNPLKDGEFGPGGGHHPPAGTPQAAADDMTTASTVQEDIDSDKLGDGFARLGFNPNNGPLDRVRTDASGRAITTNQGVAVADNQNSLKAGLRGPTLLEDFILREKITHFDHERIPERVVHARGSGAHGYFES